MSTRPNQLPMKHGLPDRMAQFSTAKRSATSPGMFGRLFPGLPALSSKPAHLTALGKAMIEPLSENDDPGLDSTIPAGFTYLGQFVDHDITFDTTPLPEKAEDPFATENFRTPALDLDCLYGNGPVAHPYLYQRSDSRLFLIGGNQLVPGFPDIDNDLPRNTQGFALIGDPRNDENLIVAQLHLAMLKFHNKVVTTTDQSFRDSRLAVTLHYQWMLLHDFLPRIIDPAVLQHVMKKGPKFYRPRKWSYIPVEFGAAAYRFGHSMVREQYRHNKVFNPTPLALLFRFTGLSGTNVPVPSNWPIDWRRFFETSTPPPDARNFARKLDGRLTTQLGDLPIGAPDPDMRNLAVRNLLRGNAFGLPSGQSVAKQLGLGSQVLTRAELSTGPDGAVAKQHGFDKRTPLWYYLLKEAAVRNNGERLGPVGSRILAEVFVGLLERGKNALLTKEHKKFRPTLGPTPGQFTMVDLLEFVGELNPVGD